MLFSKEFYCKLNGLVNFKENFMFFFVFVSRNFNEKSNEKQIKKNTWKINEKGRHFCGVEFFVFLLNDLVAKKQT